MKRHLSLEPFSRDHNVGLVFARRMIQTANAPEPERRRVSQELLQLWEDELKDHFEEEEHLLLPLIPTNESRDRLVDEHREFARYIAQTSQKSLGPDYFEKVGSLLNDHIRWEERVLFPLIEQSATVAQLNELASRTAQLEARRSSSDWSPRRGELMKRRIEQQGVADSYSSSTERDKQTCSE